LRAVDATVEPEMEAGPEYFERLRPGGTVFVLNDGEEHRLTLKLQSSR
jgi:hypothetical protein